MNICSKKLPKATTFNLVDYTVAAIFISLAVWNIMTFSDDISGHYFVLEMYTIFLHFCMDKWYNIVSVTGGASVTYRKQLCG